jgi:hypothetical protein
LLVNNEVFTQIELSNNYQHTGTVWLSLGDNVLRNLEREYTFAIPRNVVKTNGTTTIDITDTSNHVITREFKERLRDRFLISNFVYNNEYILPESYGIYIPYVKFIYRISNR